MLLLNDAAVGRCCCWMLLLLLCYIATACYTLPGSEQFGSFVGQVWCEEIGAEISFITCSLDCFDFDSCAHKLYTQPAGLQT